MIPLLLLESDEFSCRRSYPASLKPGVRAGSSLSAMNFMKKCFGDVLKRNSGKISLRAWATTNSEGGIPGRIVLSQPRKVVQTVSCIVAAKQWSSPWAIRPICT